MSVRRHGELRRPRVALVGKWDEEVVERIRTSVCPGGDIVCSRDLPTLFRKRDASEVDLLVCRDVHFHPAEPWSSAVRPYLDGCHLIVSGGQIHGIPGPSRGALLTTGEVVVTSNGFRSHEAAAPDLLQACISRTVASLSTVRGAHGICQSPVDGAPVWSWADPEISNARMLGAEMPDVSLAAHYTCPDSGKRVACFSVPVHDEVDWIRALVLHWSASLPETFPGIGDWASEEPWLTDEEAMVVDELGALRDAHAAAEAEFLAKESVLESRLHEARVVAADGPKKLLTAQDDELVDAVSRVLEDLGFEVEDMDSAPNPSGQLREDLRIRLLDDGEWEGLVEVKGLSKSAGKSSDLAQIERHATRYFREKGRDPDIKLYIINGQFAYPPELRRRPWASHEEDPTNFAADGGLIVPTMDLFKLWRASRSIGCEAARRLLVDARGMFSFP